MSSDMGDVICMTVGAVTIGIHFGSWTVGAILWGMTITAWAGRSQ